MIAVPPKATNQPEKRAPLLVARPVHFDDVTFSPFDAIPNLNTFKHIEKFLLYTRFRITTKELFKVPIEKNTRMIYKIYACNSCYCRNNINVIIGYYNGKLDLH